MKTILPQGMGAALLKERLRFPVGYSIPDEPFRKKGSDSPREIVLLMNTRLDEIPSIQDSMCVHHQSFHPFMPENGVQLTCVPSSGGAENLD